MYLAHFAPGLGNVMEMDLKEVYYWFNEAEKLRPKLYPDYYEQ